MTLLFCSVCVLQGFSQQPNIIFIYADDWGYGDMSLHGHHTLTTPNLDRLASEGTEFLQFNVCNPVCSPSRTAIMTGHYPARHHVHQHFADHDSNMDRHMPDWLDPAAPMLPRLMQENGYRTAHFGKWHLTSAMIYDPPLTADYGYNVVRNWHGNGPKVEGPRGESTGTCVDYSIDFINSNRDKPFFINLWIHESHTRIEPPQDAIDEYMHVEEPFRSYYACISYADRELGRLFQFLKDEKLDSTTLVIFSSDNGPEYPGSDPEAITYYSRGETAGLVGQKRSLFEGGVGLPFIVHWSGTVPAGKINNTTHIAAVDMLPSLCRIAGIDLPSDYIPDGEDLSESLLGGDQRRTRPVFWDWRGTTSKFSWPRNAVRSGNWKLLTDEYDSLYLYNIQASRVEENDSSAFYPELADSLFTLITEWKKTLPENIPMDRVNFLTNEKGDRVIADFSSAEDTLGIVSAPEFRIYRSDGSEIPVDAVSHDNSKIYLHLSTDPPLVPEDQLSIAFRSGEIISADNASLLFFSTEPVENRIQTGPALFTLELNVFDGSSGFRLADAELYVDSVNGLSNLNGEAFFNLNGGNYIYGAQKEGYTEASDTLSLNSDTLVRLLLYPTLATVKFRVTDGTVPLGNSEVVIDESNGLTNVVGITLFEDLDIGVQYPWSVTRTGYSEAKDTLLLQSDTTVQVVLSMSSGVPGTETLDLRVFPNPANESLFIRSARPIGNLEMFDMKGFLIREIRRPASKSSLSLTGLEPGTYLLKITMENRDSELIYRQINIL